jgi:non-specific serine/threonine protein kinase
MEYLRDQLQELHDEGHAVLVFSQFTRVLDLLETHLTESRLPLLRLDGQTPTKKRKSLVKAFQDDDQPSVFLISLKAGGVGLNLTRANYVYHVDPWWNPAVEKQAADRAHRMGQQQTVFIQRLLMRHTIEEKMMALKQKKQALFDALIEAPQAKGKTGSLITRDDFEFLLGG